MKLLFVKHLTSSIVIQKHKLIWEKFKQINENTEMLTSSAVMVREIYTDWAR